MEQGRVAEIRDVLGRKPDVKPETLRKWLMEALDGLDAQRVKIGDLRRELSELSFRLPIMQSANDSKGPTE